LGKILVQKGIDLCFSESKASNIKIEAQAHLENFYFELGFTRTSDVYPVDGIDHIEMIKESA